MRIAADAMSRVFRSMMVLLELLNESEGINYRLPGANASGSDVGASTGPLHLDFLAVRNLFSIKASVFGLQGEILFIDARENISRRRFFSVLKNDTHLERPTFAVLGPCPIAETASRVKEPGADILRRGIPADPHRGIPDRDVLGGGRERGHDEVLVLGPIKRKPLDLARVGIANPLADGPLQPAQVFVIGGGDERRVAYAVQVPLALFLDVHDGEVGSTRRAPARRQ